LLEYEVRVRLNARHLRQSHADSAQALINRITFVELKPEALERALVPFPIRVHTFDALHLASITFLLAQGQIAELASYDDPACRRRASSQRS
jgi:hypothetical protein